MDGNPKLILGLLWTLILHFQEVSLYTSETGHFFCSIKQLVSSNARQKTLRDALKYALISFSGDFWRSDLNLNSNATNSWQVGKQDFLSRPQVSPDLQIEPLKHTF